MATSKTAGAARARKTAEKTVAETEARVGAAADAATESASRAEDTMRFAADTAVDTAARMTDAFAASSFGMPDLFRSASQRTLEQMRSNYARMKEGAEETTDLMEESMQTARDGWLDIQVGTLDAAKEHSDAVFSFMKDMMGTRSLGDAVQLQTAFARERFEAFVDYSKDVQERVGAVAQNTAKPAQVIFEKAVANAKSA